MALVLQARHVPPEHQLPLAVDKVGSTNPDSKGVAGQFLGVRSGSSCSRKCYAATPPQHRDPRKMWRQSTSATFS